MGPDRVSGEHWSRERCQLRFWSSPLYCLPTPLIGAHSYHRLRSLVLRLRDILSHFVFLCNSKISTWWTEERPKAHRSPDRAAIWAERSSLLSTALSAKAVLFVEEPGLVNVRKDVKINQ